MSIQSKLLDVVWLEQQNPMWSQIMFKLPAGQMSVLNQADIDCLPLLVNLCRWKIPPVPVPNTLYHEAHPQLLPHSPQPKALHMAS